MKLFAILDGSEDTLKTNNVLAFETQRITTYQLYRMDAQYRETGILLPAVQTSLGVEE